MISNSVVVFLHFHKCAGTSFIHAAQKSGYVFPELSNNGNIFDLNTNCDLIYSEYTSEEIINYLHSIGDSNADLFACEWDFPYEEILQAIANPVFVTILRDPFDRAWSAFCYEQEIGAICAGTNFEYWSRSPEIHRKDNMYCRLLSGKHDGIINQQDFNIAVDRLNKFSIIASFNTELKSQFKEIGIYPESFKLKNKGKNKPTEQGTINEVEYDNFLKANVYDYALYSLILNKRIGNTTCSNKLDTSIINPNFSCQGEVNILHSFEFTGNSFKLAIILSNNSEYHWASRKVNSSQSICLCKLSYHCTNTLDGSVMTFDGIRSNLPVLGVAKGNSIKAVVTVLLPEIPGSYNFTVTLVTEGICWFEDYGFKTDTITIVVE